MDSLSLGQIRWNRERFGLSMVNCNRQKFFIHAEKLLELCANPDYIVEVKMRDQKPNRAIGYYPGQVLGTVQREGDLFTIILYVSTPFKDISYDEKTEVLHHLLTTLHFTFAADDLERFRAVLEIMVRDRSLFDERSRAAEATPLDRDRLNALLAVPPA